MPEIHTGIYSIQSKINPSRFYIGSSKDCFKRWRTHIHRLKCHTHENKILQNHFNKHGPSDLQFTIIFSCDFSQLIQMEQAQIDMSKPFFNILKTCHPGSYKPSTLSTRQKISASWKFRKPIPMFCRLFRPKQS